MSASLQLYVLPTRSAPSRAPRGRQARERVRQLALDGAMANTTELANIEFNVNLPALASQRPAAHEEAGLRVADPAGELRIQREAARAV